MTWPDIWPHLLLYPVYQVLSTIRHELSHALAGVLSGFGVKKITILPSVRDGKWYWGYCRWEYLGDPVKFPNAHMYLAPYYSCVVALLGAVWLVPWARGHLHVFWYVVVVVMFVISPLVDVAYNLLKWWLWGQGDFKVVADVSRTGG